MKTEINFGNKSFDKAAKLLIENLKNVYFDAAAGTGKSTFARKLKEECEKNNINVMLTAVTGVAANNIGGITISSCCYLRDYGLEDHEIIEYNQLVNAYLRLVKILVIDEVSMLTEEQLRQVDVACKAAKGNNKPFGGISVLVMGDYCQLEPIEIKDGEIIAIDSIFEDKSCLENMNFIEIPLTEIYRQTDKISLFYLNKIRNMIFDKKIDFSLIKDLNIFLNNNKSSGVHLYSNIKDVPLNDFNPSHYYFSTGNAPYVSLPIMYNSKYLVIKNTLEKFNGQEIILTEENESSFLVESLLYKKEKGFNKNGKPCLNTVFDKIDAEYLALMPLSDMTTRRVQGSTFESGCIAEEFFSKNNKVLEVSTIGWLRTLYTAIGRFRDISKVSIC